MAAIILLFLFNIEANTNRLLVVIQRSTNRGIEQVSFREEVNGGLRWIQNSNFVFPEYPVHLGEMLSTELDPEAKKIINELRTLKPPESTSQGVSPHRLQIWLNGNEIPLSDKLYTKLYRAAIVIKNKTKWKVKEGKIINGPSDLTSFTCGDVCVHHKWGYVHEPPLGSQ